MDLEVFIKTEIANAMSLIHLVETSNTNRTMREAIISQIKVRIDTLKDVLNFIEMNKEMK